MRRRVLVVDDHAETAEGLSELISLWGYEVHVAFDGPAALETAARVRPDVVLLDLTLPGMDGVEVARRLRATPEGAATVLVGLSGREPDTDPTDVDFDHRYAKPIDIATLEKLLANPTRRKR